MNTKTLIAAYVGAVAEDLTGDPFEIELIDGPNEGTRLAGCVGWAGDRWRVMISKSTGDYDFTRRLWHEVAHVVEGDTSKVTADNWDIDRALIAGTAGDQGKARLAQYLRPDDDKEVQRTTWGDRQAARFLPNLNAFLTEVEGGASLQSALAWRFPPRPAPAATRASKQALFKAICEKHQVTRFEMRPNLCAPIVEFAHSELTTAKAAADPEIWELVERVKHLGSEAMAFVASVLRRRKKYVEWVADLIKAGLIPAAAI